MTQILKVKYSSWITENMMLHKSEDGKCFFGPPLPATNKSIVVETSDEPVQGNRFYIVRILGTGK